MPAFNTIPHNISPADREKTLSDIADSLYEEVLSLSARMPDGPYRKRVRRLLKWVDMPSDVVTYPPSEDSQ
jgi:hypothetical protein